MRRHNYWVGAALALWLAALILAVIVLTAPEAPPMIRGAVLQ